MNWQLVETLAWSNPLEVARCHAGEDMALLYSGLAETYTGHDSYLLLDPLDTLSGDAWSQLPPLPATGDFLPLWVGYLGYGMRDALERGTPSPITLPDFRFTRYAALYHFEHATQTLKKYSACEAGSVAPPLRGSQTTSLAPTLPRAPLLEMGSGLVGGTVPHTQPDNMFQSPLHQNCEEQFWLPLKGGATEQASRLESNLTRAQYERIVTETIEQIRDGQFYQANITRKFFGKFTQPPDSFSLFSTLCDASPAPYAAYIKHGETAILSSSPECFLSVDASGLMTTRPIKGSARRGNDAVEDKKIREALATSEKNRAENLMIVDLMRNDLSRVAKPESVEVIEQSVLYSYRTIHHLISTVRAKKRRDISVYDAVRACFPAGSMTGAPKIAAMRWCSEQEKRERGVYSGAIGWFGAGDTCNLSVVIRTLILDGNRFEFQVGGGIVADSTPEEEWRETLAKARGICAALGVREERIIEL